jgi:Uma2 family endonuclease
MATAFSYTPTPGRRYTVDDLEQLFPDAEWGIELLDGELLVRVTYPTSRHQLLCARLLSVLYAYALPPRLGWVVTPGVVVSPPTFWLEPDVLVVPWTPRLLAWQEMTEWCLAVEVLSPSTRNIDLGRKRAAYLDVGVRELWLVDPDARCVTVARRDTPDTRIEAPGPLTWQPVPAIAPLTIDLGPLCADT